MTDEKEVNPLSSGTEEVSSNEDTGAVAPATSLPETPKALLCAICGQNIIRKGPNTKYCDNCAPAQKKISGQKSKDKKKATSFVYDSGTEPTKPEAKRLLEERGLENQHVIDLCYDLALIAAEQNDVPANRFLFQNGIRKMLESYQCKAPQALEAIPATEVSGELLNRAELYALYDFGFWRQPEVTFEQWLADRLKFKSSAFELSKILGKEDFGKKHEEWSHDFAPRWNPIDLKPGYTQREALTWLDAQSEIKRFLLVASRNSMKSTWARILALTLTITYPDARILIVSETNRLSRKAMKEFRGYLEMAPNSPTLFQQYFVEFTIAPDEGQSLIYDNPLAHLGLPQNSVESSSMESANTGSRFDLCLFDDPISRDNGTSNEDQRAEAIAKHGSIMKLREPAGYSLNVQTPWVQEDLGDVMIQRNNEDPDKPLAVRVDPVIEIRPEAQNKGLLELTEEDVILGFLPKLNWKFVRNEMRSPEGLNFFRTQYLCKWIKEGEGLKVQFDHDELWARVRPKGFFENSLGGQVWMSLDRAYNVSKYSDLSALVIGKIQSVEGRQALVVAHTHMERLKESDLVLKILELISIYHPSVFIAEKDKNWQDFWQSVVRGCANRGLVAPYFRWIAIDNTEKSFARRAKALELPLSDGRLWFSNSFPQLEQLLLQFERFDGRKRSGSSIGSKDDGVAALSLMWAEARGLHQEEAIDPEEAEKRRQQDEEEGARERRRSQYNAMFGGQTYTPPPPTLESTTPAPPRDIRLQIFGRNGKWRM